MDHLTRDELGDCEADVVGGLEVSHQPSCLVDGQGARFGTERKNHFLAVDRVDVEVHGQLEAAGAGQPVE